MRSTNQSHPRILNLFVGTQARRIGVCCYVELNLDEVSFLRAARRRSATSSETINHSVTVARGRGELRSRYENSEYFVHKLRLRMRAYGVTNMGAMVI